MHRRGLARARRRDGAGRPAAALCASLLAVLLGWVASGCSAEQVTDLPGVEERIEALPAGSTYVAIGDSYTSAPWVGTSVGPLRCARSDSNYPHLVADELDLDLVDVSCGGARTEHVTAPQPLGETEAPAQADALGTETDLVTLSLGGNDDGYFSNVLSCVGLAAKDPDGTPCADLFASAGPQEETVAGIRDRIAGSVGEVLGTVAERAPQATVLVVGYPQFAPADGPCEQFPIAEGDVDLVHRLNIVLNEALEQAASAHQVGYVDRYAASEGHDACADEPWVAGASPTAPAAPYHPYAAEQEAAAEAVIDAIEELDAG